MANIQIADLHSENVVELTAEEQSLIQGGWVNVVVTIIRAITPIVTSVIAAVAAVSIADNASDKASSCTK